MLKAIPVLNGLKDSKQNYSHLKCWFGMCYICIFNHLPLAAYLQSLVHLFISFCPMKSINNFQEPQQINQNLVIPAHLSPYSFD